MEEREWRRLFVEAGDYVARPLVAAEGEGVMDSAAIEWLPYRPSNGTEGDIFREGWCDKCERDRDYRENGDDSKPNEGGGLGCAILCYSMAYDVDDPKFPKEWVYRMVKADDGIDYPETKCTAFEPERVPDGSPSVAERDTLTKELFE